MNCRFIKREGLTIRHKLSNIIKALPKIFVMCCLSFLILLISGCGANKVSDEIVTTEEVVTVSDEFVAVYAQTKNGLNIFVIYHHIPTGQMYVCYAPYSFVPMGITYDEYVEKSNAFHVENDVVETTEQQ